MRCTTESFIERAREIHGDKYDYSKVNYINCKTKVRIICPVHGEFWQTPDHHLVRGDICPKCSYVKRGKKRRKTFEQFLKKARKVHGDKYIYPSQTLNGTETKIRIICPAHGEFYQSAHDHLYGHGCLKCSSSKGELKIAEYLKNNKYIENKDYFREKTFDNPKISSRMRFDFYLPEKNLLIEYNGEQHYIAGRFGEDKLRQQRCRDWIKRRFARSSGIRLLTIPYTQFNMIEEILKENL